ncbi:SGNH hydrolase-type esterase domain [Syntrophomonas zehnderi OL-4]|uniref:SGNH hydrolase-type esterase domain n=1 Tax=Syntrophomonas zehnderi OL-4 TaxID=690567 RepID=A0A0E3W3K7_9FIRM|nr:SGNH/GDSL hydrolase family protein [Syntrophomonas zehnderi]CFX89775.1 SGNH hydrolase-type esterase domain [Syntrophomonas zehnderi OL-4]
MSEINAKDNIKILVSGDSISKGVIYDETKGRYTVLPENYVNTISSKIKGSVRNVSNFGSTLTRGISKLGRYLDEDKPDIVLIEYGGNDCAFNWDEVADNPDGNHQPQTQISLFETALSETIGLLKNIKTVPVLMTLPPLNAEKYLEWVSKNNPLTQSNITKWLGSVSEIFYWQEKYSNIIKKVAEETQTKLIDVRCAFLQIPDYAKCVCQDGMHPNKNGHKIIADKVFEFINNGYDFLLVTPECGTQSHG